MKPESFQHVESIYAAVADLDGTARDQALEEHCNGDAALAAQVRAMFEETQAAARYFAGLAARAGVAAADSEGVLHHAGRRLGAYRLLRQIGRGGMGVVYLAERADQRFEKHVAIKVLPLGLVTHEGRARFAREQAILARLEHPHIARLLDSGVTEEGTPYYVMEYIDGVPLDEHCEASVLSLDTRLDLFVQVCEAVSYAHRNLVIHRDIKPSNILVDREGRLKLLDFGVSKLMEEGADSQDTLTYADRRPVSPGYAAPELLRGDAVTTLCDVYSLGVLLYELLTDRRPFGKQGGRTAVARRVLSGVRPPAPSAAVKNSNPGLVRRLRGDLDRIVAQAMGFEAERRYPTVNALARDLDRHRQGLPVSAMPGHWGYHASRFVRRHRIGVAFSAVVVVLLLSLAAGSVYYAVRMGRQIQITQQERDKAQAVSAMLTDIFTTADPYQNQGQEITARELVDRGLRQLEQREQLSGETRAELYRVLGGVYAGLSNFEMGRILLAKSAGLARRIYGNDSPEYARVLADLAAWEFVAGDLAAARRQLQTALATYAQSRQHSSEYAAALYLYGSVLYELGAYGQARTVSEDALAMQREFYGESHVTIARTLNLLGATAEKKERFDEAERYYRQALRMGERAAPGNKAFMARVFANLGGLYASRSDFEQALDWQQRALEIRLDLFGERHRETALSHHQLSVALHGLGRLAEAKASAAQAVNGLNGILGPDHWLTARVEANLASILTDLGEYHWAHALLDHALAVSIESYGEAHRQAVEVLLDQAELLNAQQRFADARAKVERAQAVLQLLPEPSSRLNARAQALLGEAGAGPTVLAAEARQGS